MVQIQQLFETRPLFDKEPLFDDEPIFDEEPMFDDEPVFDDEPLFDGELMFYDEPVYDEEIIQTDQGDPLINTQSLPIAISKEEPRPRHNIFHTHCTVQDKVCVVITDRGSCEKVSNRFLVNFFISHKYQDKIHVLYNNHDNSYSFLKGVRVKLTPLPSNKLRRNNKESKPLVITKQKIKVKMKIKEPDKSGTSEVKTKLEGEFFPTRGE
jgi:hypothetical protein